MPQKKKKTRTRAVKQWTKREWLENNESMVTTPQRAYSEDVQVIIADARYYKVVPKKRGWK